MHTIYDPNGLWWRGLAPDRINTGANAVNGGALNRKPVLVPGKSPMGKTTLRQSLCAHYLFI